MPRSEICIRCNHYVDCPMADDLNFCEECAEYDTCSIRDAVTCPAGCGIECNNGFEPKDFYCCEEDNNEQYRCDI